MTTKKQLVEALSEYYDDEEDAKYNAENFLGGLEEIIEEALKKDGEFALPGLIKFTTKVKPAVKKGTPVYNPFTKETGKSKGKPASTQVKVRPLTRLKNMV